MSQRYMVPSNVPWLGNIPKGWKVLRFRHVFSESSEKIEDEVVGPMLSVSGYRGIEIKEYDDENRRRLDEELVGYRIVRRGQLVVNTMWLNYAGLGVSDFEGHVSPAYRSYSFKAEVDRRYIHHLMRSSIYVQGYTQLLTGIRPNSLQMSRNDLMNFPVLLPPLPEQTAIAAFLDRETGKIDSLVEEQKRLIELLKEKRQAVISHAVTKGLNPNVRMKPSGVEWLGDVPEHWEVRRVKSVLETIEQGWSPQCENYPAEIGEWGVLKVGCVNGGVFSPLENKRLPSDLDPIPSLGISRGDVLVSRANTRELVGSSACVNEDYPQLLLCDKLYRLRPKVAFCQPQYLAFVLGAPASRAVIEVEATGASSSMLNIAQATIREMAVALPPIAEQQDIINYLMSSTRTLDLLAAQASSAIELLEERRSALISAAVTGKIDVRDQGCEHHLEVA